MMEIDRAFTKELHQKKIDRYYRFHSLIYDATRWSFLFGRDKLLEMIPDLPSSPRILEVGCGTGHNIKQLQKHYPKAKIAGIDLSQHMLKRANSKLEDSNSIHLHNRRYGLDGPNFDSFDLILCSYSLTMCGDGLESIFNQISADLKPSGYIAIVDFHHSPYRWFRRWMSKNHVNLSRKILAKLKHRYQPVKREVNDAYLGLWSYFLFIGQNQPSHKSNTRKCVQA